MKTKPIIAILLVMLFFTCDKFPKLISVKTGTSTNITTTTANIGASIIDAGDGITQYGHCWSKTIQTPTSANCDNKTSLGGRSEIGNFSSDIANLEPGTTYYVAAYALNSKESVTGKAITITTLEIKPPQLTTAAVTNITATTATSGGEITNDGGAAITARGVCWSTSQNPTIDLTTKTSDGSGSGKYESSITGLSANTTYYVRAYATNSSGTSYGNEVSCTTIQNTTTTKPVITTTAVTNITQTTATSGGSITSDGGDSIIAKGVCWSTNQNPTIDLSTKTINGTGTNNFISTISGLSSGTIYYVRAYATNNNGTSYGSQKAFSTISSHNYGLVTDIEGNDYKTIQIGIQVWMAENLKTTKYRDGTAIPNVTGTLEWAGLTTPAYCWLNNDITYKNTYGALYNWYAVTDNRNVCPVGWHVPSYTEWTTLTDYLGGASEAGKKMKETGTEHWLSPNAGADNSSGLTAFSSGARNFDGSIIVIGHFGYWWSSTAADADNAYDCSLTAYGIEASYYYGSKRFGFSVRCLKDDGSQTTAPTVTTTAISNIASTSATSGGNVTSDGGASVTAKGVCWSTTPTPTIDLNTKTNEGAGSGIYVSNITGLSAGTKYYVRAYATNSKGTAYGEEVSFTTTADGATIIFNPNLTYGSVTDIEGNVYKTIQIGTQVWMAENLKTTKYNDNTAIPNVTGNGDWAGIKTPAYCWYNNEIANKSTYGALYNWYAINPASNGNKSICPAGWHIPSDAEWTRLTDYLGNESLAGGLMKEIGTTHWSSPNTSATNESGFTALPGGYRNYGGDGIFYSIDGYGTWWSSTAGDETKAIYRHLDYLTPNAYRSFDAKLSGFSVRCVKDDGTQSTAPTVTTTAISSIATISATSGGNVTSDGGASVTAKGICWSTSPTPTIDLSTKTIEGSGTGTYVSNITGLSAGTKYYVRAYATNSNGTSYGNEVSFTTLSQSSFSFEMVLVEGGKFIMGCTSEQIYCNTDEKPTHQVTISSFNIGKYEVTQKQWRDVMGNDPSFKNGCDNCPVENVGWDDVQGFITKLNEKTGKTYRLPTESEWEFAARGGNAGKGYQFAGSNTISDVAWYSDNSSSRTHAVGTKTANELGIYDMSGNVWEWCSDWYGDYSADSQTDPQGATSGSTRVLRGGSWGNPPTICQLAYRNSESSRSGYYGFRLVLVY